MGRKLKVMKKRVERKQKMRNKTRTKMVANQKRVVATRKVATRKVANQKRVVMRKKVVKKRRDQRPRERKMKRKRVPRRSPGRKRTKTMTRRKRARTNRQQLIQLVHLIITTMPHIFELPILYLSIYLN